MGMGESRREDQNERAQDGALNRRSGQRRADEKKEREGKEKE